MYSINVQNAEGICCMPIRILEDYVQKILLLYYHCINHFDLLPETSNYVDADMLVKYIPENVIYPLHAKFVVKIKTC